MIYYVKAVESIVQILLSELRTASFFEEGEQELFSLERILSFLEDNISRCLKNC